MAITVPNQWTATGNEYDVEIKTTPTTGNWLVAVISWRTVDGSAPAVTVGDLPRNLWTLLGTSDNAANASHIQVWACPHATFDGWELLAVYVAAMQVMASDTATVTCSVFEGAGLSDWLTVDSVTVSTAAAATTFSIVMPTPAGSANCLMVGAASIDNAAATLTVTSAGWTALTQVSRTGPDVKTAPMWRTSTATQTPAWSSSVAANWVGIAVAIKETGTTVAQPNANFPYVLTQIGLGYDVSTPLQAVSFTTIAGAHRATRGARGMQAELGEAQTEQTVLLFDDPSGSLDGRASASATASAVGTTITIKVPDAQATNILYRGDYFRLWAGGVLKQAQVFQIQSLSSAAGTTTITFSPAASASTAVSDVLTTTPLDINTPFREVALYGGKWYSLAAGWLESSTQTYTQGEGLTQITATGADVLKLLAVDSPTALRGEIFKRTPTHWWPLDDPSGAGQGQNLSGYSQAQLVQVTSKFGAGSGSADFGAATQLVDASGGTLGVTSLLGDPASSWRQEGLVAADIGSKGFALVCSDSLFPSIANGVTIFGVGLFPIADQSTVQLASTDPTLVMVRNADPGAGSSAGSVIKLAIDHSTLQGKVSVWDKATHAATATLTSFSPLGNLWTSWALVFDTGSWAFYSGGTLSGSGSANLTSTWTQIDVGGEADQFNNGRSFNAYHCEIAVFGRKLSVTELGHMNSATTLGKGATGSEKPEQRIVRKLNTAGWKGGRIIASSGIPLAAETTETSTVIGKISDIAGYEDATAFSDAAGQVQFRSRQVSYHQVSRATLGENTAGGEIPYQRDVQRTLSPTFLYNLIRISNTTYGSAATSVTLSSSTSVAASPASAAKYSAGQGRAFDRATRLSLFADSFALACWLLAKYALPGRRISQLTIDAAAYPAAFPFILGVEIGDLVTVNRRPVGAPPSSQLYKVLRVEHDRAAGRWFTTLTLGLAPASVLVLGDSVKGILGNNGLAA